MAQELTLKTNHTPSYFNKDTALGGMLGLVVGGIALNAVLPGAGLIAGAIGAVAGGFLGKQRMEAENHFGKKVGEPSAWNKDTALGGLIGVVLSGLAVGAAILGTIGGGIALGGGGPVLGGVALLAAGAALIGTPIVGAMIGGRIGKNRQARELEEAKQQTIVENISRTVSPEVGQAVAYTMEHNKQWGKQITEEKLLAAAQANEQAR